MKRETFVQALRDIADWYETTEVAPIPYGLEINVWSCDVVQLADVVRSGGQFMKKYFPSSFELSKEFATEDYETVKVTFNASRDTVCTKRVVGTRKYIVPAVEAREEREEEEDIVVWDCHPLLANEEIS